MLCKKPVMASGLAEDMAEDFRLLALQKGMTLKVENALPDREILVDEVICYRVLENLVSNALRYARHEILLEFSLAERGMQEEPEHRVKQGPERRLEPERRVGPEHGVEPEHGGTKRWFLAVVTDDGEGFSEEILKKKRGALLSAGEDGHMGIGLSMGRILCKKHGGGLELGNGKKGAWVRSWVMV